MRIYPLVILVLTSLALTAAAQSNDNQELVVSQPHFSGTLDTRVAGKASKVRVDYRTWSIAPGTMLERLPLDIEGDTVFELHSGKLATRQGDQEVERRPGSFWTLKRGAKQSLQTFDDSVVLRTIVIQQP